MIKKFAILDKILSIEDINKEYENLLHSFDKINGGFGEAPKYIDSHKIMFLLKYYEITGEDRAVEMAIKTLDCMYMGGMFDHVGYGFFNKSLDDKWRIPIFEKTIYDNCFISIVYLEAYEITGDYFYKDIANKSLEYVFRKFKNNGTNIYYEENTSEYRDYYLFTPPEIISVLGKEDGAMFCVYYNITSSGTVKGKSIPNLIGNKNYRLENIKILELSRKILNYRNNRIKIKTNRNNSIISIGLLLCVLGKAYEGIGDSKYLSIANSIIKNIQLVNGIEFSYFIMGLIEIYEASHNMEYLNIAIKLNKNLNEFNSNNSDILLDDNIINPKFIMIYNNMKLEEIMKSI